MRSRGEMHYLSYISRARADLIAALRRDLADLDRLSRRGAGQGRRSCREAAS